MENYEDTLQQIPLWFITPSPAQPRSAKFDEDKLWELAQSITSNGLIQPVVVVPVDDDDGFTLYELVAGERRVRAVIGNELGKLFPQHGPESYVKRMAHVGLAGMGNEEALALKNAHAHIAAIVHHPKERVALQLATVAENIARESLSPIEEARAFARLMRERQWSQRELATQIGVSQGYVGQRMCLLDLAPVVQEAVNTQVITIANARDIVGLPEYAQEPAAHFIAKWSAGGETTRVISDRVKAVKAMLDPQRWEPNPAQFYEQQSRNYMKLLASVAQQATVETAMAVFAAAEEPHMVVVTRSVKDSTRYRAYAEQTLKAMGVKKIDPAYLAGLNGDSCGNCIFRNVKPEDDGYMMGYCARWGNGNQDEPTWCDQHIGADEPELIKLEYFTIQEFSEDEMITKEGNHYVMGLDAYMRAYNAAGAKHNTVQKETDADAVAVEEIRQYCDWVKSLNEETRWHFQSHACSKCVHYEPTYACEGLPPCRFAREMLKFGNGRGRSPRFGMLVSKAGVVAPRCEMYRYSEENIKIAKPEHYRSFLFGFGLQIALDWMQTMYGADNGGYYAEGTICGALNWLPYPRHEGKVNWSSLFTYIHTHTTLLKESQGIALLINSVMYEGRAVRERGPWPLLNVETGDVEDWMPAPFPLTKWFSRESWPKNWFKPWEKADGGAA